MRNWILGYLFFSTVLTSAISFSTTLAKLDQFNYSQYFVISEKSESAQFNLLYFTQIDQTFPLPSTPYKRVEQFGTWVHDQPGNCMNTRAHIIPLTRRDGASVRIKSDRNF